MVRFNTIISIFLIFTIFSCHLVFADEIKEITEIESNTAWTKVNGNFVNSNNEIISGAKLKGIDVSSWQYDINWESVSKSDIDFVIIRCGYGKDIESQDDTYFKKNIEACKKYNIPFGVYLYSYALDTASAKSEAQHVLRLIKGYNLSYPVFYDLEDKTTDSLTTVQRGEIAKTFCDTISNAGYDVGIYASLVWWNTKLIDPAFNNNSWYKWIAQWGDRCTYNGAYDLWQCTDAGRVNGIKTDVDLNFWFTKVVTPQTFEKGWYSVSTSSANLNIRESSSTSSKIMGTLEKNDIVNVTSVNNSWGYVTFNDVSGWIYLDYCNKISNPDSYRKIKYVYPLNKIDTIYATSFENLNLPTKAEAFLTDGTKTNVDISWDSTSYDLKTFGTQIISGTASSSYNFASNDLKNIMININSNILYEDVFSTDWFFENVKYVKDNNLMNGITERKFEPQSKLTRAMLVTILYRASNETATGIKNAFTDVSDGNWYSDAVNWAYDKKIVNGISENEFAPNSNITREQIAVILKKYSEYTGNDTNVNYNLNNYKDASEISAWANDGMKWAVNFGLINGTGENTLNPKATATRAEVATIISRFMQKK